MVNFKKIFIILTLCCFSGGMFAQLPPEESLFTDDYNVNSEGALLKLSIDNISFFKNNETDGDIASAYTMPGFRLSPRIQYFPNSFVKLEAGVSLLKYWGTEKYPNYAYQDIAEWKADHYQHGFHLTPFFRAQIQPIPQLNIVLGTLYGGQNHDLIEPFYSSDLSLTADPETGAQLIYNSRVARLDTWVNWESFTFRNEEHNEAFSIGGTVSFHITDPKSFFYLGVPVQAIYIHRGGEIDAVKGGVVSMANGAAGLRSGFNLNDSFIKGVSLELMGVGAKMYNYGDLFELPMETGWGLYTKLKLRMRHLDFKLAYWRSGDIINLYGNPVYGNMSTVHEGRTFPRVSVFNTGLRYEQKFGSGYYLGADIEGFYNPELKQYYMSVKKLDQTAKSYSWSVGLYLRINPSIILKEAQ